MLDLPGGPLPPELLQILHTRGFHEPEAIAAFLAPEHYHPALPSALPDLNKAVSLLKRLLQQPSPHILIWGDFDVDGQTSTALLVESLIQLGAHIIYHIPNRQRESHGVHLASLRPLLAEHHPDLLLICDTGSAHHEAIEYAKASHIPVIVADHHELADTLPSADAFINPQRLTDTQHPLRTLSGVGVSYLLIQALYDSLGRNRESRAFLDFVALGLVADLVELVKDTRYLVQLGLNALRTTNRLGLVALCQLVDVDLAHITEQDISFKIAPALNALGRLDSATKGVELLTTRDVIRAQILAQEAVTLNRQRRHLTSQVLASAQELIEHDQTLLNWDALVLYSPNWHSGIVGIVAAQLADQYQKPTALLVVNEEGAARGSVRSITGYHVGQALAATADILLSHGGHELAGGLAIDADHLPLLRRRLSQAFAATYSPPATPALAVDAELSLERLSLDFAHQVRRLAPFGPANPLPVFMTRNVKLASVAKIGKDDQHRRLTIQDTEGYRQAILWWQSANETMPSGRFNIAYTLDITTYKDAPQVQAIYQHWEQLEPPTPDPLAVAEVIDCRQGVSLDDIRRQEPSLTIWAEGYAAKKSPGLPLSELTPAAALVVLTRPARYQHLIQAVEQVKPQRVYLIAATSPISDLKTFVSLLEGLLRVVVEQQGGETSITQLRERLATTEKAIRLAVQQIAPTAQIGSRGKINLAADDLTEADDWGALQAELNEIEAYHRYLLRADANQLLMD
ncbi:MAG: single-stranded-DNA-specific exonuclease RecJ [Anaerolineales bacterium]|nr:single-stranded-DNA-specific exonuclease RecJ [Anaerolineales bacterium]